MYVIVKALIEKGRVDGLREKVGKLYLYNLLSDTEHKELMDLLG
jgi:hypothetical protein